jgi:autoinducer 2 (AI-2) kinase
MAIDAGTGSCRAMVFDADGRQISMAQHEWRHLPEPGVPGSQRFDTGANWALICACTREALARSELPASAIAAVSATSMREGIVLYDEGGAVLLACPNVDARAGVQASALVQSGEADQIYALAGDWVAITSPARLRWFAEHDPGAFASVRHAGMLSDWILHRLSGRYVTEPSCGSSSGMFSLADRDWSDDIIALCGLAREVFPEVVEPGTPIGAVTASAAHETGLTQNTVVVAGGADTQMALLGLGLETGSFAVIGGTFWQHAAVVDRPLIDPDRRLRTLCHAVPGEWMLEGIGFYSGMSMRWFRDAFCAAEVAEAEHRGVDPYDLLEDMARDLPPGAGGVVALLSNVMNASHWVHCSPTFLGFDLDDPNRSGKGACIRAIEEAAAYVTKAHFKIVAEVVGKSAGEVTMAGGAASGSLWPAIISDVTGVAVRSPEVPEASCLGTAYCALAGVGLVDDPGAAARANGRWGPVREPDPSMVEAYAPLYDRWLETYAAALDMSARGLTRPLWQAAGT